MAGEEVLLYPFLEWEREKELECTCKEFQIGSRLLPLVVGQGRLLRAGWSSRFGLILR